MTLVVLHTLNVVERTHTILETIFMQFSWDMIRTLTGLAHFENIYILLNCEMASNECRRGGAKTIEDYHYSCMDDPNASQVRKTNNNPKRKFQFSLSTLLAGLFRSLEYISLCLDVCVCARVPFITRNFQLKFTNQFRC